MPPRPSSDAILALAVLAATTLSLPSLAQTLNLRPGKYETKLESEIDMGGRTVKVRRSRTSTASPPRT
jgi:hypothetical protein